MYVTRVKKKSALIFIFLSFSCSKTIKLQRLTKLFLAFLYYQVGYKTKIGKVDKMENSLLMLKVAFTQFSSYSFER